MILRLLQAKRRCKKENRAMLPKDLFHLKGFMVAGTDNLCYKDDLEELWGIRSMEFVCRYRTVPYGNRDLDKKRNVFLSWIQRFMNLSPRRI